MLKYRMNVPAVSLAPISDEAFPALDLRQLLGWSLFYGIVWLFILSTGSLGGWIGSGFAVVLLLRSLILLEKGRVVESLGVMIFLGVIQPAIRVYATSLLYLMLEYSFIFWALLFLRNRKLHWKTPAIWYFFYLILETLGLFLAVQANVARNVLITSLTVGVALLVAGQLHLGKPELRSLFTSFLLGIYNLLIIIAYGYATGSSIRWGSASNFSASGDMAPVQISMLLAVGILILLMLVDRVAVIHRLVYLIQAAVISVFMVLTFSRNGLYLTILGLIAYYLLFNKFSFRSLAIIFLVSVLGLSLNQVVTQIAGPALVARYSQFDKARPQLIRYGWKIFRDNPLFGVGTSNFFSVVADNKYLGQASGAHNELIRAAAEHGVFGLITWISFAVSCIWLALSAYKGRTRALRMTLAFIFFAYLAVNGLKILIQPLTLMIALSVEDF